MSSWKARLLIMLTILAMLLAVSMGPAIANDGSSDDGVHQNFGPFGHDHDDDDDDDDDDDFNHVDVDEDDGLEAEVDRILGTPCFIVYWPDEDGDEWDDVWLVCIIDGQWVFVERLD
jgi:hypothetical protein